MWAGPTQKNKSWCVLRVACCLWVYLASQKLKAAQSQCSRSWVVGCLLLAACAPGSAYTARSSLELVVQDLRLRLEAAGPPDRSGPPDLQGRGQYYFNLIPDPLLHPLDKSSVHNGSGIMGGASAHDLKFLADLKTSTKLAELRELFHVIHAKRVGRAKHFFIVDLVPFILVLFWKVHWSNISFT